MSELDMMINCYEKACDGLEKQNKALHDERDRLQLHIKSLGGRFKRLDAFLANGRTVEAHQLVKNTIEALDKIEAALTPAGGQDEHK